MALKKVAGESNAPKEAKVFAEDTKMKQLLRQYMKANPECVGEPYAVIAGRLTTGGWFLLETKEFVLLIPGASHVAKSLFTVIFPGIDGKEANQLMIVPDRSDKYGGYLATEDTQKTKYVWDAEDYILYVGARGGKGEKAKQLSLEDFF